MGGGKLSEVLFLRRLSRLFAEGSSGERMLDLYLTGSGPELEDEGTGWGAMRIHRQRINREDLMASLGPVDGRRNTVAYVCGPAAMTDEVVGVLEGAEGMEKGRVFCEKWW